MAKISKNPQGFGETQPSTQAAKRFLIAFGEKEGDEATLFLEANLEKLDESLLETLPLVFEDLTREKDRDERRDIAGIFCNFGNLLQQFPRGIRWLNLELSIRAYELALQVCTYQFFPQDWAALQMNLGIAYSDRIRGERAENLELAIVAYENALQIFTRDTFPEHWARSQLNLADAYRQRVQGDPEVNIEQAIKLYHQA
ncbi:MAG: hypothetical protein RLZZ435_1791, partial [Cyanobacteriota bacterium]